MNLYRRLEEFAKKFEGPIIQPLLAVISTSSATFPDSISFSPTRSSHYSSVSRRIEDLFEFAEKINIIQPDPAAVRNYLIKHDDMIDLLYRVGRLARNKFGYEAEISLEVFHDPEEDYEDLTLYVRKNDYQEELLKKFEEIDDEYGEELADKSGYLAVTTDFKHPRF